MLLLVGCSSSIDAGFSDLRNSELGPQTNCAAIIIGFPIALVLAWAFELTPEGIKHTEDVDLSDKRASKKRTWIYVTLIGAALSAALFFVGRLSAPDSGVSPQSYRRNP